MHHDLTALLASSRERELRSLVRRPDRLFARELTLAAGRRRTPRRREAA